MHTSAGAAYGRDDDADVPDVYVRNSSQTSESNVAHYPTKSGSRRMQFLNPPHQDFVACLPRNRNERCIIQGTSTWEELRGRKSSQG
jgi:hypothetical protein